jgi:hypothetical protein
MLVATKQYEQDAGGLRVCESATRIAQACKVGSEYVRCCVDEEQVVDWQGCGRALDVKLSKYKLWWITLPVALK